MTKRLPFGQPDKLGWVEFPELTVSYPRGGKCRGVYTGTVTATQERLPIVTRGIVRVPDNVEGAALDAFLAPYRESYAPELFVPQLEWAAVAHNQRTQRGWRMQVFRCFGTIGQTDAVTVFSFIACGASAAAATPTVDNGAGTLTVTDLSMGTISDDVTTHEFLVGGIARAAGTPQNLGTVPASFDGTSTNDIYKSFTCTATARVYNTALFDSVVGAPSNLYAEVALSPSSASVVNTDTLNITWTSTF